MAKIIILDTGKKKDYTIFTHPDHRMLIYYFLLSLLVITIPYCIMRVWNIITTRYYIHLDRIVIEQGLINITRNEIQWYRIKSFQTDRSLFEQFFGLSSFLVFTSDKNLTSVKLLHMDGWREFEETFTELTEKSKRKNKDKELNLYSLNS